MREIDRNRLEYLLEVEEKRFLQEHSKSYGLFQRARKRLQGSVPMLWMIRWAGTFPIYVKEGKGAHFVDVDGNEYIDFCLGDTGAMTGHSPEKTGVESIIDKIGLPWIVKRLGCRSEYWFREIPPRNGGDANAATYSELDR